MSGKKKKKKLTAKQEFKKRSEAAKLGHLRRRVKEMPAKIRVAEKLADNARIVVGKKPRKRPDKRRKPYRRRLAGETLEQENERLRRELAYAETERIALEETRHFVHTRKPEYLREDWTLAVLPSRLRHRAETEEIRKELKKAHRRGKEPFEESIRKIAEFYDVDVREVYTLWESP